MIRYRSSMTTLAAFAAALLLTGCALPASPGAGPTESAGTAGRSEQADGADRSLAKELAGRTFLSTTVRGRDLVPDTRLRLTFRADGVVGANAGCNDMGGPARWRGDRLAVTEQSGTSMNCEMALMDQEDFFANLLRDGVTVALNGDELRVVTGGFVADFLDRKVADPDRPLVGTTWVLDGIVSGAGDSGSVSSVPAGMRATFEINGDTIRIWDGLNGIRAEPGESGEISVGPDRVTVRADISSTAAGCAEDAVCSVDMSLLTHDFDYSITADRLTVTGVGPTAGHGFTFRAAEGAAVKTEG